MSGPLAAAILASGVAGLAFMVPGYSHIQQTVSEIGETGSPARWPFTLLLGAVAVCLLLFAYAVAELSVAARRSRLPAIFIAAMAVSVAGVGLFAHPHPLHNVFGISQLLGYQAPLAFALVWRANPSAKGPVAISWLFYALVFVALVLNLSSMDRQGTVWAEVAAVYGVVQRALFAAWFGWAAAVGIALVPMKAEVRQPARTAVERRE